MKYSLTLALLISSSALTMEDTIPAQKDIKSAVSSDAEESHINETDINDLVENMNNEDLSSLSPRVNTQLKEKDEAIHEPITSTWHLIPEANEDRVEKSGNSAYKTITEEGKDEEDLLNLSIAYDLLHKKGSEGIEEFREYHNREQEFEEKITKERESLSDDKQRKLERLKASKRVVEELERAIEQDDDKIKEKDKALENAQSILILEYLMDLERENDEKILTEEKREEALLLIETEPELVKSVKKFIKDNRNTGWFGSWLSLSAWSNTLQDYCNVM